jgi:hypothetical protein
MKQTLRNNGLSLVLGTIFLVTFFGGQVFSGWFTYNDERTLDGLQNVTLATYLRSPHFLAATAENWESEFLQLYVYVVATIFLFQRGSAESKDPDRQEPERPVASDSPRAVRRGGLIRAVYARSLYLAFGALFVLSFVLHGWASVKLENEERARRGEVPVSAREHLAGSRFWFESFQNWQSEFLAIGSVVFFTIFLRQEGSPESKAVSAPHGQTGR